MSPGSPGLQQGQVRSWGHHERMLRGALGSRTQAPSGSEEGVTAVLRRLSLSPAGRPQRAPRVLPTPDGAGSPDPPACLWPTHHTPGPGTQQVLNPQHPNQCLTGSWVTPKDQFLDPMLVLCWALGAPICPPPPGSWVSPCGRLGRNCVPACAGCPGPAGSQPAQHQTRGRSRPGPGWLLPASARVLSAATGAGQRSAAGPPAGWATGEEMGDGSIAGVEVPALTRSFPAQPPAAPGEGHPQTKPCGSKGSAQGAPMGSAVTWD